MGIKEEIKQSKFQSAKQMAMINIVYTANWIRDHQQNIFKKYNILPQHYNILRIVNGKFPEAVSPSDIKELILDKGRDLTRLVDKLVSLGLLKRQLCENNRRKMEIFITVKGQELINESKVEISELMDKTINISEEESQVLSDLLDKIRSNYK
jgi:MarR family 2-MHQ and catechol resistance regulon transcriptional repressor